MTMPAMTTSAGPVRPQGLLDRVLYLTTLVPHWLIALLIVCAFGPSESRMSIR